MKKIALLLLAVMLFATLTAIPANADSITVKKGTPVIDGKLESLWKDGPKLTIEEAGFNPNCSVTEDTYAHLLWDDQYLYVGVEVHSTDITDYSGICVFATFSDDTRMGCYVMETFTLDSEGAIVADSGDSGSSYIAHDINMCYAAATTNEEEGYYVIEFAISLKKISAGTNFGMHIQVSDDIDNAGEFVLLTNDGFDFFSHVYKLIRSKAQAQDEPEDTTAAPVDTAAPAGDDTTAPADNKSEGGCGSVMGAGFVTLLAVACVPVIASRKRK